MSSFLEDIEFASKVNEAIKEAEQRGKDNSLELTKEMIKQQYGDIETYKFTIRTQQQMIDELISKIDKAIEYIKEYILPYFDESTHADFINLLEILGDKE